LVRYLRVVRQGTISITWPLDRNVASASPGRLREHAQASTRYLWA
jgi:hypothetical protein